MSENNIKAVMLSNGAEFITEVTEENDNVSFRNPVTIIQDASGNARFAPWFAFASSRDFVLPKTEFLFIEDAGEEVVSGYQQAFGLIQSAPQKKIII